MTTDNHNTAIRSAAREILRPLGCIQKGRSRTWLDDQGWWLGVVEFQPSGFSKGSYLNVAAHWLWHVESEPTLSFDDRADVERPWRAVEVGVSFEAAALELASIARDGVHQLRLRHGRIAHTADWLSRQADTLGRPKQRAHYHAGVACGLAGRMEYARRHFRAAIEPAPQFGWQAALNVAASAMAEMTTEPSAFRGHVVTRIQRNRFALKLMASDMEQALS